MTDLAVTVTVAGLGTVGGAVYSPVPLIFPQLVPEQPVPATLQATLWLAPLGLTIALNCVTVTLAITVALEGTMATPVGIVDGAVEEEEHAAKQRPRTNAVKSRMMIAPFSDRRDLESICVWP
jgi:hypothetical protein